jgi:hypothetical protein
MKVSLKQPISMIPALLLGSALFLAPPVRAQYSTPMRDVDNPARQPVNFDVFLNLFLNTPSATFLQDSSITVPAGKRLVIETISIDTTVGTGQRPTARLESLAGGKFANHIFPQTKAGSDAFSDYYQGLYSLRLYADPNTSITLVAARDSAGTTVNGQIVFHITGYYVNLP